MLRYQSILASNSVHGAACIHALRWPAPRSSTLSFSAVVQRPCLDDAFAGELVERDPTKRRPKKRVIIRDQAMSKVVHILSSAPLAVFAQQFVEQGLMLLGPPP